MFDLFRKSGGPGRWLKFVSYGQKINCLQPVGFDLFPPAPSAVAVEYIDCIFAEGKDSL